MNGHGTFLPANQPHSVGCSNGLFPVLASTYLCMDLLIQQNGLDLRAAAEIVGRDPGAVLRLFATIAEEIPDVASRPERLEDCIVALGIEKLLCALGRPASVREEQPGLFACAQHGWVIAHLCRVVASSLGLKEEPAYLLGLLHGVGADPGEQPRSAAMGNGTKIAVTAMVIARRHHVPDALVEALEAVSRGERESLWVAMLQAAHDLADARPFQMPGEEICIGTRTSPATESILRIG